MGVVPESACLVRHGELVREPIVGDDGALSHKGYTISPIGSCSLFNTMPMLRRYFSLAMSTNSTGTAYDSRLSQHGVVTELVVYID